MAEAILLLGSSGHARVLADIISAGSNFYLVGIIDDFLEPGTEKLGSVVVGNSSEIVKIIHKAGCNRIALAIGHNHHRMQLAAKLASQAAIDWQTLIHPSAIVARDAEIGCGTTIMAGAIVGPGCNIGQHAIINTRASVDHDCYIGDGASIGPGACLGGNVKVNAGAIVALGANVINAISIGANSLVGAGATLTASMGANLLAVGTPARVKRERNPEESYL